MRKKLIILHLFSIILPVVTSAMTREDAFELLQKSDRWHLTQTLTEEKSAQLEAAKSEFNPKAAIYGRQFAMHTNPIQYGIDDSKTTISTIAYGSAGLAGMWTLMDPVSEANLLSARSKEKMSQNQTLQLQQDLTAAMLFQYLTVQKLKRTYELSQQTLSRSELILNLATSREKVGAGIPLDIARAHNLVNLDRIHKMMNYNKLLKAQHDLALSLGVEALPSEPEDLKSQKIKIGSFEKVLKDSLSQRVDLKNSRDAIDFAEQAQTETRKKLFPKVQLVAEAGSSDVTFLGLPGRATSAFGGVTVTIPLESGGLIEAKRREANNLHAQSELMFQDKLREANSQVKESLENLTLAEEGLNAAVTYRETSQTELDIAKKRFVNGVSNTLDYSNAHNNLTLAEDSLAEAEFNYEAAKIGYFRSIGDFSNYFTH